MAIVAGSKVSTKLTLLNNLAQKVDRLIVGGGIANTFLLAEGFAIGKSLAEPDLGRRMQAGTGDARRKRRDFAAADRRRRCEGIFGHRACDDAARRRRSA